MRCLILSFLISVAALGSGCAHSTKPNESPADALKHSERISYHDRNGDGKVDEELHKYVGFADTDWALRDDDYDGRFEKKIHWGFALFELAVDLPVPTGVQIKAKK